MSNSLVAYDHILKTKDIKLELCDNFVDGVYIPKD
jgi:hypothetical protein